MSDLPTLFQRLAANAPALAQTTAVQRVEKMQRLMKALLAAKDEIVDAIHRELHSPYLSAAAQLLLVKIEADYLIQHLAEWMQPEAVEGTPMLGSKTAYVRYEPKGIFLNLNTWNAPIACGFNPCFGAIAAGNAVVLKPSELAPYTGALMRDIVHSVFPENEFAVVEGGADVAQELLKLPFNHIYYTGGQRVGRLVMQAAAEHFASVTLEMGGKNPTIVDASADIGDAVKKISTGRLGNAGQVCISPDYALVHASQHDRFVTALGAAMTAQLNADGKGFKNSPNFSRLISNAHFARVKGLVEDALAKGAQIAFGGEMDAADRYIGPTIVTGVNESMKIMQEEIFGPVMPVLPFQEREQAAAIVARRPKPLALYIYATERAAVDYFLAHTTAGSTAVNNNVVQAGIPTLPFGGIGHSGMGRVNGKQSFREFSNARAVVEDALDPGANPAPAMNPEQVRQMIDYMLAS